MASFFGLLRSDLLRPADSTFNYPTTCATVQVRGCYIEGRITHKFLELSGQDAKLAWSYCTCTVFSTASCVAFSDHIYQSSDREYRVSCSRPATKKTLLDMRRTVSGRTRSNRKSARSGPQTPDLC